MQLLSLLSAISRSTVLSQPDNSDKVEISSLCYDSREVGRGALFFAIEGLQHDGHLYLGDALAKGAAAIASERPRRPEFSVPWVRAQSIRAFMAECAHQFFDRPSTRLRLAGITGTNGKTTTAYLVHSILQEDSEAFLMGSIKTAIGADEQESRLTTPESVDIQSHLEQAVRRGCRYGVMEVSSHALAFDRVFGCHFPVAVFTNLSQDHLDFHEDFDAYFNAKRRLFDKDYNPGLEACVLNGDDPYSEKIADGNSSRSVTFGMSRGNQVHPLQSSGSLKGLQIDLSFMGRELHLESPLIGRHNLYNIMAAATTASLLGIPDEKIRRGVSRLASVPGRFEKIDLDAPYTVVVDFAHTPDALRNVLELAAEVTEGRTVCLFGCGGDRDRTKRPLMGEIGVRLSDHAILTSDNPRSEDPEAIIRDIEAGIPRSLHNYEVITDRRAAIRRALELARPGDLILLAGKGHETYQSVRGRKIDFDERKIVREVLCSS